MLECEYFEVSSKESTNVANAFDFLLKSIVSSIEVDPESYFKTFQRQERL